MRIALLVVALMAPAMPQEKASSEVKPPRRGDDVLVRGCVSGGTIDSSEVTGVVKEGEDEKPSRYLEFVTFRLTGDKKVLQEIRAEHAGHADVLKGELRTDLPKAGGYSRTIGNSRIGIGVGRGMAPEPPPPLPVLKVSAIEHTGITCR